MAIIEGWLTQNDLRATIDGNELLRANVPYLTEALDGLRAAMPRPAGLSVESAQKLAAIDSEVDEQDRVFDSSVRTAVELLTTAALAAREAFGDEALATAIDAANAQVFPQGKTVVNLAPAVEAVEGKEAKGRVDAATREVLGEVTLSVGTHKISAKALVERMAKAAQKLGALDGKRRTFVPVEKSAEVVEGEEESAPMRDARTVAVAAVSDMLRDAERAKVTKAQREALTENAERFARQSRKKASEGEAGGEGEKKG